MKHRFCKDCHYFKLPKGVEITAQLAELLAQCLHPDSRVSRETSKVTGLEGTQDYSRCANMRTDYGFFQIMGQCEFGKSPCGPEAKLFKERQEE